MKKASPTGSFFILNTFVCMRRVLIEEFLRESRNALLLDVRSPAEYRHAHIPGAVSFPLFTDEERKVVGTEYKQVSRQAAIKIGLDYFGPKMRPMVEEVERLLDQVNRKTAEQGVTNSEGKTDPNNPKPQIPNPKLFVYCWRGGMRSGAVSWLLNLYGFDVTVLAGGYKAFRNWVLQTNAYPYRLNLLGGYTGSGKTALLKALSEKGELVLDLEALANHKGSAFGNIGMPAQPSQEMFENNLALAMTALSAKAKTYAADREIDSGEVLCSQKAVWIEDESQRIGHINIPQPFWQTMRRSPVYFLDIPFEERLQNIVAEYGQLDKERMIAAIERITKRLGGLEAKNAIQFLQEGATEACFRILLHYYDKQYLKGLNNRTDLSSVLTKIPCEKVTVDNAAVVSQAQFVS